MVEGSELEVVTVGRVSVDLYPEQTPDHLSVKPRRSSMGHSHPALAGVVGLLVGAAGSISWSVPVMADVSSPPGTPWSIPRGQLPTQDERTL